jgi:valyl-tRNA synthetase
MSLSKTYNPQEAEPRLQAEWQQQEIYHFDPLGQAPVYSIDTPPATVSGNLHLGHVYSYSHPDFIARFWRMNGRRVYYPMGYDDNGLPTERLVEKRLGIKAQDVGRTAFIEKCLQVSEEAERDYEALWQRLGLSIDWRFTYRTIDERSRRTSQLSFIDLYQKGLAYRREAPAIWCPECQTSIAQAELNDLDRETEFVTLPFRLPDGRALEIATTRPELLPACVAVFVHPGDERYQAYVGQRVRVPLFGQEVPVLEDPGADPEKGTGAVMCCTFGDTADVAWWYTHKLPLVEVVDRRGRLKEAAGPFAGLPVAEARQEVKRALEARGELLRRQATPQSIRVHERCDTPVEYIVVQQWFVRVLEHKEALLKARSQVQWHPPSMRARYESWVENLNWDWCLSRQRYFGVPFPVWTCEACGETVVASADELPVDPSEQQPPQPCRCGSTRFIPDPDVMDTWATSSMSPQIAGRRLPQAGDPAAVEGLYAQVFPFSLRPQAHEIIRTWAFYTILKSTYHFDQLPWKDVLISGWGLAGEGMGKISKSRSDGPLPPLAMIERYSADAVRYWAASASPGKDSVISEEKIQMGQKLVTKLWNVARFAERFIAGLPEQAEPPEGLSAADRWILSRLQRLIRRVTVCFEAYDYASAKHEIEGFFWRELADNYLEMSKLRLYDEAHHQRLAAQYTLRRVLVTLLKLFAPLLPYITDAIYRGLFSAAEGAERSIHATAWPLPDPRLEDDSAEAVGEALVEIATAVRRYKSEHNLPLGSEINRLQLASSHPELALALQNAQADLHSITRARRVELVDRLDAALANISSNGVITAAIER